MKPVIVLISCRNRPLYLWACLDSLFRHTTYPRKFILIDMHSDDPLVQDVITGFRRRGMFDEVIFADRNDPGLLARLVMSRLAEWAPYFAYVEADTTIEKGETCWLQEMVRLMDAHPKLAMLGSTIDRGDFVDPANLGTLAEGRSQEEIDMLLKAQSPERRQDLNDASGTELYRPHSPAGRHLMLRTEALQEVGLAADSTLDALLRKVGFETAIATRVKHRHLSLLHIFDYPNYDYHTRNRYMTSVPPKSELT